MIADCVGMSLIAFFFYIGWLPVAIPLAVIFGFLHCL